MLVVITEVKEMIVFKGNMLLTNANTITVQLRKKYIHFYIIKVITSNVVTVTDHREQYQLPQIELANSVWHPFKQGNITEREKNSKEDN